MLKILFVTLLLSLLTCCNKKNHLLIYYNPFQSNLTKLRIIILILRKKFFTFQLLKVHYLGHLPNINSKPVANIDSNDLIIFDTISHESILEDQGRDPISF